MSNENLLNLDDDFLQELRGDFIDEARELIEAAGEAFLELERDPNNKEILNKIFRVFHNVKGSAKAVGFLALSDFAHKSEDLLVKVRDGHIPFTLEINDILLACNDGLADGLARIQEDPQLSFLNELVSRIENCGDSQAVLKNTAVLALDSDPLLESVPSLPEEVTSTVNETVYEVSVENKPPVIQVKEDNVLRNTSSNQGGGGGSSSSPKQGDESIKLPTWKINNLLDYFGEQVILQSKLGHLMRSDLMGNQDEIFSALVQLDKITSDLQQTAITLRMVSLKPIFNRMERTIRDIAIQTGKKVRFEKMGQNSELDKTIVDSLVDPLTHMVRNAVDHGIESPEERVNVGKDAEGVITLKAYRQGGSFYIEVIDNGRGLSRQKIYQRGVERGLLRQGDKYSDSEIYGLIFNSGFSTKEKVSDISGRGVGMDVVRDMFMRLKGTCEIESDEGRGSRFVVRLPLTLALFNGTLIGVDHQKFIVPNSDYTETVSIPISEIQEANRGEKVVRVKDRVMSVISLESYLKVKRSGEPQKKSCIAAVTRVDSRDYAVLFDELYSQEKVVLKKLGPEASQMNGISGGTILGDGNVALVLELKEIIQGYREAV